MIERLARLPVDVDYASEYRYRDPIADPHAIGLLITQSGETADTIAAQTELIAKGSKTLAICNVVGAAITRRASGTITTNAGPEIGVASTKAFTSQLTALFLLALHLAQVRGTITPEQSLHLATELSKLPGKLESMLSLKSSTLTGMSEGVAAPSAAPPRRIRTPSPPTGLVRAPHAPPPLPRRALPAPRQASSTPPTTSSSSAEASTTPSPSKAPSSSRRSPTSTPKATLPAR